MIQLRVLGRLDLADAEGRELRSLLAQPKRLALLVYLALATPRQFSRRDSLMALFWPDLDEDHARGALRQAIRFLRKELVSGVVVSRGEDELGIDSAIFRCDAAEFDEACDHSNWSRALELYRGDLLAGTYIADGSTELEHWVERKRAGLRSRAAAAAWSLVAVAERAGDPVAAVPWARRAVELSPDDEAGVRRLIRILDSRGDRAGALGAYEAFRRRLAEEYGALPSPETEALLLRVRTREVQIWESPLQGWPPNGPAP
ncbi:MAG TPA: bacterial transcriptional activator domain-containing protein [Gemmatimonadales bacterium]